MFKNIVVNIYKDSVLILILSKNIIFVKNLIIKKGNLNLNTKNNIVD